MGQIHFRTNIGVIVVSWNERGKLSRIEWSHRAPARATGSSSSGNSRKTKSEIEQQLDFFAALEVPLGIARVIEMLKGYFDEGQPMTEFPWDLIDHDEWTEFQREIYEAVAEIPHGETRTYAWVAHRVGKFGATRAVGQALRRNPLLILVPCHRVVAVNDLGGFMGRTGEDEPELHLKKRLIQLEESYRSPVFSFLGHFSQALLAQSQHQAAIAI